MSDITTTTTKPQQYFRSVKIIPENGEAFETRDRKVILDHLAEFNNKIIEDEIWVQKNRHNNYEVSNYGRVKNKKFNKFLKPYFNNTTQFTFHENYRSTKESITKLVFEHFKPEEYEEGATYKHLDGNIFNNHISNIVKSPKYVNKVQTNESNKE